MSMNLDQVMQKSQLSNFVQPKRMSIWTNFSILKAFLKLKSGTTLKANTLLKKKLPLRRARLATRTSTLRIHTPGITIRLRSRRNPRLC